MTLENLTLCLKLIEATDPSEEKVEALEAIQADIEEEKEWQIELKEILANDEKQKKRRKQVFSVATAILILASIWCIAKIITQ